MKQKSRGSKAATRVPADRGLPSKKQILDFLNSAQGKAGKREIARAFGVSGGARIALKRLLAEMADEGTLAGDKKHLKEKGRLPAVAALEVTGRDDDGDLIAKPVEWDEAEGKRPTVRLSMDGNDIGIGDRVLARLTRLPRGDGATYEGALVKKLLKEKRRLLGIYRAASRGGGGTIEPINRKELKSYTVLADDTNKAADGDLVRFALARRGRFASSNAQIVESLGNPDDQRQISLIAVHAHGIPEDFPESVLAECETLPSPTMDGRVDLRTVPLITIDPVDARDHDDAVHAEADSDARNSGGFIVTVAIADVAHYIRPGSKLDKEAQIRGNSVYFPDRVVPMLPEKISNDLCSLRENEDRPCLAVRLVFDRNGEKRSHTFVRAMMRSAAKLSYQEAQAAIDGNPSDKCQPLMDSVLKPLWAAYEAVAKARDKRGPLDLDLPERRILLDENGRVARVTTPERLTAHRLIEEFMIQANVAAAETLEQKRLPVVYRVHDAPSAEKLKGLRDFLETLDMKVPHAGALKPEAFNKVLAAAKDLPVPDLINEVILRSQSQAEYTPTNIGHFGLNLMRYAHFTSPIRRYADLLIHRALIKALNLGPDGLSDEEVPRLASIAKAISDLERRAMAAERETNDRLIAAHLADRVGATFEARIAGVTRSGLFVRLKDTGADGYIPISGLGDEYYEHVEAAHALVGTRSGTGYRLGDAVEVRLLEAIPSAGALRFEMLTPPTRGNFGPMKKGVRGSRGPKRKTFGKSGRRR
ncbi:ribonuclease R [Hyphomicrobium methylovorum]|uniref:ribonuclease R n=1 Tax=Hyphomicrobium methylovorum TaxID=84 RepID=UPI0015E7C2CC|nr:ribonuclease R [Hyphomicrobium methylovorum]MBA2127151.1 ribonuclease R [Hyphomicrobium methylovorum]